MQCLRRSVPHPQERLSSLPLALSVHPGCIIYLIMCFPFTLLRVDKLNSPGRFGARILQLSMLAECLAQRRGLVGI